MPVYSQTYPAGENPLFSNQARHYVRTETPSAGIISGSTLTAGDLIPCQLTRQVSEATLADTGLMASEAGRVKMPIQFWETVKIGDELQIDGQRWQILTSPMRHSAIPMIAHCEVTVRTAQAVGA